MTTLFNMAQLHITLTSSSFNRVNVSRVLLKPTALLHSYIVDDWKLVFLGYSTYSFRNHVFAAPTGFVTGVANLWEPVKTPQWRREIISPSIPPEFVGRMVYHRGSLGQMRKQLQETSSTLREGIELCEPLSNTSCNSNSLFSFFHFTVDILNLYCTLLF